MARRWIFAALAVALASALWRYTPLAELLTQARVVAAARWIGAWSWAPILVVLAYTPAAFLMFPRPLLTLFAVVAFGPWLGLTYSTAGAIVATLATYAVGRALPYGTVRRLAGKNLERLTRALRRHGLVAVVAANMVPVPPFGVQGIIAGAVRVKAWDYLLGCTLSMAPGVVVAAIAGKEIAAGLQDASAVSYGLLAFGLLVFAVLTYCFKRWTRDIWAAA